MLYCLNLPDLTSLGCTLAGAETVVMNDNHSEQALFALLCKQLQDILQWFQACMNFASCFCLHCAWPWHHRVSEEFIRSRLNLWVSFEWNKTQVSEIMIEEQSQVLQVPLFLVAWWVVWWGGAQEKWRMHGKGVIGEVPWPCHFSCSPLLATPYWEWQSHRKEVPGHASEVQCGFWEVVSWAPIILVLYTDLTSQESHKPYLFEHLKKE